jgi:hypothetical protein
MTTKKEFDFSHAYNCNCFVCRKRKVPTVTTQFEKICIECQECCKWVTFTINFNHQPTKNGLVEYYEARGLKVVQHSFSIEVMIPTHCQQLSIFGCGIYESRPVRCRHYDGRKDPLLKDLCQWPKE